MREGLPLWDRHGPNWLRYAMSAVGGWWTRQAYEKLECYCNFLGTPRSGHTIVGSLLNAHPDAVIAHELGAMGYLVKGFSARQLFWLLLKRDRNFSASGSRQFGFDYRVPGQWQGRARILRVIGDKRGGDASRNLRDFPGLLGRLPALLGLPLRWIHVVRCPFDNIATMARHSGQSMEESSQDYFSMLRATEEVLRQSTPQECYQLQHEDFILRPAWHMQGLCRFLGLDCPADYLEACVSRVFPQPTNPRLKLDWPATLVAEIAASMDEYPSLSAYTRNPLQRQAIPDGNSVPP